jgi:hypothetical protein
MAVKASKTKHRNGRPAAKGKRTKAQEDAAAERLMTKIENDPHSPPIAKEIVALLRERDKSGEPYLTIEQIQAELGRC